jgi:hypothetical protein
MVERSRLTTMGTWEDTGKTAAGATHIRSGYFCPTTDTLSRRIIR